jgi:hypothetical protein
VLLHPQQKEKKGRQFARPHPSPQQPAMEIIVLIIVCVGIMQLPLLLDLAKSLFPSIRMARFGRP